MKTTIYQITAILAIVLLSGLLTNCSKDGDNLDNNSNTKFPLLIEGNNGRLYKMSYLISSDYQVFDSLVKISDGVYKLIGLQQEYIIKHIQLYKGNNQITLSNYAFNESKYPTYDSAFFANSHLYDMTFRNARVVSEDSIVGEYYNSHYYETGSRKAVPDSGIFAIKISH